MRKLMSFVLLAAGLSFGAFAYFPASSDRDEQLAAVTAILANNATRAPATTGALRDFSPKHEMRIAPASGQTSVAKAGGTQTATVPASRQPAAAAPVGTSANFAQMDGWQAVVTTDAVPSGVTSSKPGDMHARYELVLDLQRELKRAGCYGGTLSGSWNANTKRAMSTFMDRVNASLPLEEPDYILLMLVKGRPTASCVTCPMGQALTDGRCIPVPVVAQTQVPAPKPAKKPTAQAQQKPQFRTVTAAAEPDIRAAQPAQVQPPAPLPGRMSVGGPGLETAAPSAATADPARNDGIEPSRPPVGTRTAALADDEETAPVARPATALSPPAAAGYPGTKSGRTATPSQAARSVTVAPAPRRAERPSPRPQKVSKRRYNTRSVQNLFQHPLGRL